MAGGTGPALAVFGLWPRDFGAVEPGLAAGEFRAPSYRPDSLGAGPPQDVDARHKAGMVNGRPGRDQPTAPTSNTSPS